MQKANLNCLFGSIPEDSPNLEIVGAYDFYKRELPWASVWGDSGLVIDNTGEPVWDCLWQRAFLANCPNFRSTKWRFLPQIKFGTYFNTMLFWCRGYYHWICDVLPRIQQALPYLPSETKFIIPGNLPRPFLEALEAVGVPLSRCEVFSGKRPWRVQRLIHVPPVAMTGDHTQKSLLSLRGEVFKNLGIRQETKPRRKLYISRRNGLERVIVNEKELLDCIEPIGFEQIFCEDLSFVEQVRLFSEAELVFGPHGGGLTNTIWCNPGTKVAEIFHPKSVRRCYWSIAQAIGLNHSCGVGKSAEEMETHGMGCDIDQVLVAFK
jgi:capsular polysaccharide biosynthesis protein